MLEADYDEFADLLDGVCSLLSRGKYTPNATNTALFFRSLARHPMDAVRAGFEAHVADTQRGQFVPNPADILAQIEGKAAIDGRPDSEEAWALSIRAADESETIVWTAEMAQAWQVCQPVMATGDKVGARMAFKQAYDRHVDDARRLRIPATWSTSLGHDAKKRHAALVKAETMGLLPAGEAMRLAAPELVADNALTLLLETSVKRSKDAITDPAEIKARAAALKAMLVKPDHDPAPAAKRNADIANEKARIQALVEAHPAYTAPPIEPNALDELSDLGEAVNADGGLSGEVSP